MTAAQVVHLITALSAAFERERETLGALDAAIGDGDHGAAMARGFARAREVVVEQDVGFEEAATGEGVRERDVGALLGVAGRALMAGVGGASGALFATVLLEVGKAAAGRTALATAQLATGLERSVESVARLGRSQPGDKTMLDALAPAAEALAQRGVGELAAALSEAAEAAARGAEATREMPARRGRARYTPDAGVGHVDPGATSVALLLATWRDVAARGAGALGSGGTAGATGASGEAGGEP